MASWLIYSSSTNVWIIKSCSDVTCAKASTVRASDLLDLKQANLLYKLKGAG